MLISDPGNLKEANRLAYVEIERLQSQIDAYKSAREKQYARITEMRDAINGAIRAMNIARIEKTEIYGPSFETGKILSIAIQQASDALANLQ